MRCDCISQTAQGTAAARAVESRRLGEDRLFEDIFARGFLKPFLRGLVDLLRLPGIGPLLLELHERQFPGAMGKHLCRTRFIDDALRDALEEGLDQVVILGAGFDSRAYRIPGVDGTRFFEVDNPTTQAWKQKCLKRMLGSLPSQVTFVPIDFDRQELDDAMAEADFRTGGKVFFIWEGVSQYITAEAVDATFRYISRAAAAGSRTAFTYVRRDIVDGSARSEGTQRFLSHLERLGEPWIFGIDPAEIAGYLSARGLELVDQVGPSEYRTRYLDPLGRQMNVFDGELTVLARIDGTSSESTSQ